MEVRAVTENKVEFPNTGMVTVVVLHLSCKVLDHFIVTVDLEWPKTTSSLYKCLDTSNEANVC